MYRQQICKKCRYEKHVKPWRDRSGWHGKHRDWVNRNSRRLKKEALDHYGGKCSCCGESEEAFLCLDHVNGGGNEHRKELKQKYRTIWEWLKAEDYPGGFQVLCANCNMAKSLLGACPHKLSMTG